MSPLFKGKGQETIGKNIKEMMNSKTFAKDKDEKKKRQMAIAAALDMARRSSK